MTKELVTVYRLALNSIQTSFQSQLNAPLLLCAKFPDFDINTNFNFTIYLCIPVQQGTLLYR